MMEHHEGRMIGIKVGALPWTEFFRTNETMLTAGIDLDLWRLSSTSKLGLYFDTAGEFEDHSPYDWYGGGFEFRQYIVEPWKPIVPYVGLGVGYYSGEVGNFGSHHFDLVGGKAFAGLQLRCGVFLEAQYNQLDKFAGRDFSRFGLSLGYRF